jgi:hypothetical protein
MKLMMSVEIRYRRYSGGVYGDAADLIYPFTKRKDPGLFSFNKAKETTKIRV